jgi:NAD(P)-dependent dehydrogenase (short-subunit alcohol dehydrogenase family)
MPAMSAVRSFQLRVESAMNSERRDARDWWRGRTAIITGASSGIGLATAQALLHRGCRVALIARSADRLAEVAAPWGEDALVLPADVRDRDALRQQIHAAIARWGRVDLLVHSAGVLCIQLSEEFDEAFRTTIETDLLGAVWATQAVVPTMRTARFGRIVYVGSVTSHVAPAGYASYAISKWGLRALTESLRCELRSSGIRVSLVSPYYVRTPMLDAELREGPLPAFDSRAVLEPEEAAAAILRAGMTGQREIILAPWTIRLGLLAGKVLPGIQERVLEHSSRPLVDKRSQKLSK